MDRLYKKKNYTILKSIKINDRLYEELKEKIRKEYNAKLSEVINVCIEEILDKKEVCYCKVESENASYRNIMIRKDNEEAMIKIKQEKGISITMQVNTAIKEFLKE